MKSPQHILVPCHAWYGDVIGGAFRLATEFALHLAQEGYRVSYVCCADKPIPADNQMEDIGGVRVHRYQPPEARLSRLQRLRYHVGQTAGLCRQIHQALPVAAVSSHSPLQGLGAAQALRKENTFINYTVHSPFDDELLSNIGERGPGFGQKIAARIARWVDRRNVAFADRVQTDSNYTLQNFRRKHQAVLRGKGVVSPGWVECEQFVPAKSRRESRRKLGSDWDTKKPLIFTLRRLESRMGLDTLIHACQQLVAEGLEFRVLIGGGGSMKAELRQMIEHLQLNDYVRLLGRLPEEQLSAAYAAADCFVLPTRALECFGLIVLEAFACNTPVIASAVAAIPELAERQGNEWMFTPGDPDELADRLKRFVTGQLNPTVNLRDIAMEFDRKVILRDWQSLLKLPDTGINSMLPTAEIVGN